MTTSVWAAGPGAAHAAGRTKGPSPEEQRQRRLAVPMAKYEAFRKMYNDAGHYLAGTGESPIPFIEKYHERIVSLHLKDRTKAGGNVAWGQGETPLKEMLQLLRKNKWTFPADIELEYPVPQGSTDVAEVTRCVQYCKNALA